MQRSQDVLYPRKFHIFTVSVGPTGYQLPEALQCCNPRICKFNSRRTPRKEKPGGLCISFRMVNPMFSSRLVPVSCTARSLCVTFAWAAHKVNLSLAPSGWGHGAQLLAMQVHGDTTTPGRGLGNPIPPTQLPPGVP